MKALYTLSLLLTLGACKGNSDAAKPTEATVTSKPAPPPKAPPPGDSSIAITVDGEGYHPATVTAPAGKKAKLVFTRTTDKTCGTEVVFTALNIKKDLPLNQPTPIEIDVPASGQIAFACGMGMLKGKVVVQ